jgi:hypothetical protein
LQIVSDDCGLELSRQTLDVHVILDPVFIVRRHLLCDNPTWSYFLTAKIDDALVIPDMLHRTLKYWIVQSFLATFVAYCSGRYSYEEGDSKDVFPHFV